MEKRVKTGGASRKQFAGLASAWQDIRSEAPEFGPIRSTKDYERMNELMEQLLKEVGEDEEHELADLLDVVSTLVEQYEDSHHAEPAPVEPKEVLRFFMEQHGLRQSDLNKEIGSQGVVSEILSGRRELNTRQVRALAKRFGVSPAVFIEG